MRTYHRIIFSLLLIFCLKTASKANSLAVSSDTTITIQTLGTIKYTGNQVNAVVGTNPTNQLITITYNGSTKAPKDAGTYEVIAKIVSSPTIADTAQLVITKDIATINLLELNQVFDSKPKQIKSITSPDNLKVKITYDGSPNPPTTVGLYEVIAIIDENNYQGQKKDTLKITKAKAKIIVKDTTFSYNETANPIQISTFPIFLHTITTYNGDKNIPVLPGTYSVKVEIQSINYEGDTTVTMNIEKGNASILVSDTIKTYDKTTKSIHPSTNPSFLKTKITYDGKSTPPINAGEYNVKIEIDDPKYKGIDSVKLKIKKSDQQISFIPIPKRISIDTDPIKLNASTSSGLPPKFTSSDPKIASIKGDTLTFLDKGIFEIIIKQEGDSNYLQADSLTYQIEVLSKYRQIKGQVFSIGGKLLQNGSLRLIEIDLDGNLTEFSKSSINNDYYSFRAPDGRYTIQYLAEDNSEYLSTYYSGSVEWEKLKEIKIDTSTQNIEKFSVEYRPIKPDGSVKIKGEIIKIDELGNKEKLKNVPLFLLQKINKNPYSTAKSDDNGSFEFSNINTGDYELQIDYLGNMKQILSSSTLLEVINFKSITIQVQIFKDKISFVVQDIDRVLSNEVQNPISILNPVDKWLKIMADKSRQPISYFDILNLNGKLLKQITPHQNETKFNIEELSNGIYLLRYKIKNKIYYSKFMKR